MSATRASAAITPIGERSVRWPRADLAILALFWAVYVLPFTQAVPFVDGIRDLQFALDIARGDAFPLLGPVFGNRFHLGPVGYYLQALPLWVGLPLRAVPLFLGLLAGSKFALAYALGRELVDRRYGLLFAAALALPGWSGLDFFNTTTPLLLPALLLATGLLSLGWLRDGRALALPGTALAASLAIHAHPSAVLLAVPLLALCAWQAVRAGRWALLATALCSGLLPLLPALYAVAQFGAGVVISQAPTVTVAGSGHSVQGWIDSLHGFALGGPLTTLQVLGSAQLGTALAWLTLGGACFGVLQLIWRARRDRLARRLTAILLSVGVVVFAVRSSTPWYFMQTLTLVYAAALAYGWFDRPQAWTLWVSFAAVLALAQGVLVQRHLARGEGHFPSVELMDVRAARGERGPLLPPWISVAQWDKLADLLCAAPQRTLALHGVLARGVDDQGALAARARCPVDHLQLGGAAQRHWVGLPRALWSLLQWSPQAKIGSLGVFPASLVVSPQAQAVADPRSYPLRPALGGAMRSAEFRFRAPHNALVLVSQLTPALSEWRVDEVRIDGQALNALYVDVAMQAFRAPGDAHYNHLADWSVRVSASAPEWVDIVTIASQHAEP